MTAQPRLPNYLRHMQEAVQNALRYTVGMDNPTFQDDRRTQPAVFFNFVILGEAASKLMAGHSELLIQYPQVPRRSIRDMRNQVAHGCFARATDVVWRTVQYALPDLLAELPAIIAAAGQQDARMIHRPLPCKRQSSAVCRLNASSSNK